MTHHGTLISVAELEQLMHSGQRLRTFDCSFDLGNPSAGSDQFVLGHIPGARHAHLDHDLSAHGTANSTHPPASGGRHPLPAREDLARWLASHGVDNNTQVVVYDRQGQNYCGRLWWMLKWCGHDAVAVLDGGWQAWLAAGGASEVGPTPPPDPVAPGGFALKPPLVELVTTATVQQRLQQPGQTLIDARATPRYRGDVEPLDPVAGHIPGALNRPFSLNLGADGFFKPAAQLRAEFVALLAGRDPATVVHHCGSGVSAVPNVLAMAVAGLGGQALYAGSWSEWCRTPDLPVATGDGA